MSPKGKCFSVWEIQLYGQKLHNYMIQIVLQKAQWFVLPPQHQKRNSHYTPPAIRSSPSRTPLTGPAVAVPAVAVAAVAPPLPARGSEKVIWIFMLIAL